MKRQLFVALTTITLVAAMSMTAFAEDLSYQITSGDTGQTVAWTNPYSGEIMTLPVVATDAKITLMGNSGQPIIDEHTMDGSILVNDGFMGDFGVYPTQELDIADILERLDSNRSDSAYEWMVPFPENWVCFVGNTYDGSGAAFCVSANPASLAGKSNSAAAEDWVKDSVGWWWRNADGSYPASEWKEINGKWYYFEENGYMAANKWIDGTYYVGADGAMYVNATTPDGYKVDANGKWIV